MLGRRARVGGGDHLYLDQSVQTLSPYSLDATEVSLLALQRCVLAGQCLLGHPTHPVREQIDQGADLSLPVTGLSAVEAMELCSFLGGRLPTDQEWDKAAAHCGDANDRARFPWDCSGDTDALPLCLEGSISPAAANHQETGTPCPGRLLPVGSYPAAGRIPAGGEGSLFDLAGNAGEWTLPTPLAPDPSAITGWRNDGLLAPLGIGELYVRGGDYRSGSVLLENAFRFVLDAGDANRDALRRAAERTGLRCVYGEEASQVQPEPACPLSP
jgi:formylglycine-generating enzyme required for sulfatase activity